MGYGVVKPSLGKTMVYVRMLAIAHFVFGLVYAITSLLISPDTAGMNLSSCETTLRTNVYYRAIRSPHRTPIGGYFDRLLRVDAQLA